jgi:hypothetical protein
VKTADWIDLALRVIVYVAGILRMKKPVTKNDVPR